MKLNEAVEKGYALNKSVEPWQHVELEVDCVGDHPSRRVQYEWRDYWVYAVDPTTGHDTLEDTSASLAGVEWYYAGPGRVNLVGALDPDAWE